ncbi:MAG: SIR2 family protein [Bacillota bacterium]|nr:SIR2 family protein [Bacillota bacterium]
MADFSYLPTEADREAADELAERMARGSWVLFSGAGTSHPALPLAKQLTQRLYSDLGVDGDPNDLALACTRYVADKGQAALIAFLREELNTEGIEPSCVHECLLALEPNAIFTTNCEDMWEKAGRKFGVNVTPIIRGTDMEAYNDREQLALFKLHGDLSQPDTLILTQDDYAEYPKDQVLNVEFLHALVTSPVLFVGYSAADENLAHEMKWIHRQVGGHLKPYFLVTETIEDWRRRVFEGRNIKTIQLSDYANLGRFLSDLRQAVVRLRPRRRVYLAGVLFEPVSESESDASPFLSDYLPIKQAIEQWRLSEAEPALRQLLERVPTHIASDQDRDFRQRLLLALANVVFWRYRSREARDLFETARRLGPFGTERLLQASTLMVNLRDTVELEELLKDAPHDRSDFLKLQAMLAWLKEDTSSFSEVAATIGDDLDIELLKCRAALSHLSEDTVDQVMVLLDHAWELSEESPLGKIEVASLSDSLLRELVSRGLIAGQLDRPKLIDTIRSRYARALDCASGFRESFPEVYIQAIASKIEFHRFMEEDECLDTEWECLKALQPLTRERALAGYLLGKSDVNEEIVDTLYSGGYISTFERALLLSDLLEKAKRPELAERELRTALEETLTQRDREHLLEALINLLVDGDRVSDAQAVLQAEGTVTPEFSTIMRGLIVLRQEGRLAAIEHLRRAVQSFPRSRLVLTNLVQLLNTEIMLSRKPDDAPDAGVEPLAQEALSYAEALYQILPSPENRLRIARLLLELEHTESALGHLEELVANKYLTRSVVGLLASALVESGRALDAAHALGQFLEEHPNDYELSLRQGIAFMLGHEYGKALTVLEAWADHPQAGAELFIALGKCYQLNDSTDPQAASRALDMFRRAFEIDPSEPALPSLLLAAGLASGRSKEVWGLIAQVDLSNNPFVKALPHDDAIELLRHDAQDVRLLANLYSTGMIPFATFEERFPRPGWFLWMTRMQLFRKGFEKGGTPNPIVVDVPRIASSTIDLANGLLLDVTALLTLGCLDITQEVLEALRVAGHSVFLFPGCMQWLDQEILRLQVDQMPAYRRSRKRLYDAVLRSAGLGVSQLLETDGSGTAHPASDACAAHPAFYVDDYVESLDSPGDDVKLIRSSQLLDWMVRRGLISPELASAARSERDNLFAAPDQPVHIVLDRPILMSRESLMTWFDLGLMDKWLGGEGDWPKLLIGPWAWSCLSEEVAEAEFYQQALTSAMTTRSVLVDALRTGTVEECAAPPDIPIDLGGLERAWDSAVQLARLASERGAMLWTDDLFIRLGTDDRGLLADDPKLRAYESRLREYLGSVVALGTEDVLTCLANAGALPGSRRDELSWSLFIHGYRILDLRFPLRWLLARIPYDPESPAVQYTSLFRELERANTVIPVAVGTERRDLFTGAALVKLHSSLVEEVWATSGLAEFSKKHLANTLVGLFERAIKQPWSRFHEFFWQLLATNLAWRVPSTAQRRAALSWLAETAASPSRLEVRRRIVRSLEDATIDAFRIADRSEWSVEKARGSLVLLMLPLIQSPLVDDMDSTLRRALGVLLDLPGQARLRTVYTVSGPNGGPPCKVEVSEMDLETAAAGTFERFLNESLQPNEDSDLARVVTNLLVPVPAVNRLLGLRLEVATVTLLMLDSSKIQSGLVQQLERYYALVDPDLASSLESLKPILLNETDANRQQGIRSFFRAYLDSFYLKFRRDPLKALEAVVADPASHFVGKVGRGNAASVRLPRVWGPLRRASNEALKLPEPAKHALFALGISSPGVARAAVADMSDAVSQQEWGADHDRAFANLLTQSFLGADLFDSLWGLLYLLVMGNAAPERLIVVDSQSATASQWIRGLLVNLLQIESQPKTPPVAPGEWSQDADRYRREIHAAILRLAVFVSFKCADRLRTGDDDTVVTDSLIRALVLSSQLSALFATEMDGSVDQVASEIDKVAEGLGLSSVSIDWYPDMFNPFLFGPDKMDHFSTAILTLLLHVQGCFGGDSGGKQRPYWWSEELESILTRLSAREETDAERAFRKYRDDGKPNRAEVLYQHTVKELADRLLHPGEPIEVEP